MGGEELLGGGRRSQGAFLVTSTFLSLYSRDVSHHMLYIVFIFKRLCTNDVFVAAPKTTKAHST